MRVGFIGLGNMGRAAARNLQRAGFGLVVYDIRAEAGDDLIRDGAMRASSPAALIGEVDVVLSMVFGPAQIEEVLRGPNGLLAGDCAGKTWVTGDWVAPWEVRHAND